MSGGICMFSDKVTVQSVFKHGAFENGRSVLILQVTLKIFIVHKAHCLKFSKTDWTIKNCRKSSVSGLVTKLSNQ